MKNLFIGLGVLAMIGATSCKKDYTCECTYDDSFFDSSVTYEKAKKSDAEDACSTANTAAAIIDGKCELK